MKKLALFVSIFLSFINIANADTSQEFKTIDQALKYCPDNRILRFIANNKDIPNSAGTVRTYKNNHLFESIPTNSAMQPKSLSLDDVILDAEFRIVEDKYGYISNNVVTCFYSYQGFTGVNVALTVRQH